MMAVQRAQGMTSALPATVSGAFEVAIDSTGEAEWAELIQHFDDATVYQTWAYGAERWGEGHLSHIVLTKNGALRAAAQLRIVKLRFLNAGIAYLFRGPLWRVSGAPPDPENFRQILRALRLHYGAKHGLVIRLLPNECDGQPDDCRAILEEEGFQHYPAAPPYRTFLLDLTPSLESLRNNLHRRWRRRLRLGESHAFEVVEGTGDELYLQFKTLYQEMHHRKRFVRLVDVDEFRRMQQRLPDSLKLHLMICKYQGEPVAADVFSTIGATAIALFEATNRTALALNGARFLKWRQIAWLKERGVSTLDLGGIDRCRAAGPYGYKLGLAGKDAAEATHLGTFEYCGSPLSRHLVHLAENTLLRYRQWRFWQNRTAKQLRKWICKAKLEKHSKNGRQKRPE